MIKKIILLSMMVAAVSVLFTGCFGMGGSSGASATLPPQGNYDSADAFAAAVKAAKADASAVDDTGLRTVEYYYGLTTQPEGSEVSSIMVATSVLRVEYVFGPVSEEKFDNKIQIGWYRTSEASNFMSEMANNLGNTYDVVTAGGIDYLHVIPDIQLVSSATPESSTAPTATPQVIQYCQIVYWVQDDACFMAAVPLSFTKEDIGKYCHGLKIPIE